MIRKFDEKDLEFLQGEDIMAFLEIQYNGDVIKDEVYTLVSDDNAVKGVLYFKYDHTWFGANEPCNKIILNTVSVDEETRIELFNYAKSWADKKKAEFPDKKVAIISWLEETEHTDIQFYLKNGFNPELVCPCLGYDLNKNIPVYELPDGMTIETLPFEGDAVNQYIEATKEANDGTADSINQVWFMSGNDSFKIFVVKCDNKIVSAASIWHIEDYHAAVENIFTAPDYRHRNLARCIITYALKQLKEQEYKLATLSVRGTNGRAIRLYESLGFELEFNQIEMRY